MKKSTKVYSYSKRPFWQWLLLYVIIGGIVYAGVYYFFLGKNGYDSNTYTGQYNQPTINPTANWQTYTNTKDGYSIKYPSSLFIDDSLEKDKILVTHEVSFLLKSNTNIKGILQPAIGVNILPQTSTNVDTFVQQLSMILKDKIVPFKSVTVDGQKAYRSENLHKGSDPRLSANVISTYVGKDNRIYDIAVAYGDNNEQLRNIYDQMLSTFKFINH